MKKLMTMLIGLLALCACGNDLDNPEPGKKKPRVDIPLTRAESEMALNGNDFAFNLYRKVSGSMGNKSNVVLSPISVSYAFSMLTNGAEGVTEKEIREVLGFGANTRQDINEYNRKMLEATLELDPQVSLETANSIWLRDGLPVLAPFRDANKTYYKAEVNTIDFSSPQALAQINGWASKHTNGRIPSVLDEINPETVFCILNAICFKGEWLKPFEKSATKEERFTNVDGKRPSVPMMKRSFNSLCFKGDNYEMLSLPYGNGAFEMCILLPDKETTTAAVIAGLNMGSWAAMWKNRDGYKVNLKLPRFNTTCFIGLKEIMKSLGMLSAFSNAEANFSSLSSVPTYVSDTFQRARIEVDEEGTKAEAVTVITGDLAMDIGPSQLPVKDFFVDRPFVYLIREVSSNAIFFIGEINQL